MKINDIINELFQPGKKNWEWNFRGSEEVSATFEVSGVPYKFYAGTDIYGSPGTWEVEFSSRPKSGDFRGHPGSKFGLTGTGNSVEVMSVVSDIMREFLQEYQGKIDSLVFSAAEPSRQALYKRMIQRLLPNWDMEAIDAGTPDMRFVVYAPGRGVTEAHQHTEIIRHEIGDWVIYLDNHSVTRAMVRQIGPRMMSELLTWVSLIPDLEKKVSVGQSFWIQDIKTNSSFYFKRLDIPSEPLAVRCETGVKDVPRAGSKTPVFKVNAYSGPEHPQHIQAMKRAKLVNRFVGTNTMASTLSTNLQKTSTHPDVIHNPETQDSKRYDRAFSQSRKKRK